MRIIIQLHQHRYPNDQTQVRLISTLLSCIGLAWFALLLECQFPLLNNFQTFIENFAASFGN
jgi:hypothetical protein